MKPKRREDVKARTLGDECLLYDEAQGSIHVVNPMAELVWSLCDGEHDLEELEAEIRKSCSVPDDADVVKDLEKVLSDFANLGILAS